MNLAEMQSLMVDWLDDPNQTYFTPAKSRVWVNNAQKELQKKLLLAGQNYYTIKSSSSMVLNQGDYVLPSDFLELSQFQIVISGSGVSESRVDLRPVTLIELDAFSQTTGCPRVYCIKRNCISVRPYPDQAYVMYLHYSYAAANMTFPNDTPDAPDLYHEYIAILGALNGYVKDGRDMSQLLAKKLWYEELMKQKAQTRNVDAPRRVRMTDSNDVGPVF